MMNDHKCFSVPVRGTVRHNEAMIDKSVLNTFSQEIENNDILYLVSPRRNGSSTYMLAYDDEKNKDVEDHNDFVEFLDADAGVEGYHKRLPFDYSKVLMLDEGDAMTNYKDWDENREEMPALISRFLKSGKKIVIRTTPIIYKETSEYVSKIGVEGKKVGKYELLPISKDHMRRMADLNDVNVSDSFLDTIDEMRMNFGGGGVPLVSAMRTVAIKAIYDGLSEGEVVSIYKKLVNLIETGETFEKIRTDSSDIIGKSGMNLKHQITGIACSYRDF
jgi:hypothetical protein